MSPDNRIRTAVIGVGYLGRFHADKYAELEPCRLVAVCDTDVEAGRVVADKHGVRCMADYRELAGEVDAVSIAVPTEHHYPVARFFLDRGVHVLVEKPFTSTVAQADELVELARSRGVVLQVGHLERFNAAFREVAGLMHEPLFVESHRLAPFKPRGTDVSVILDLMIHDIDIILSLVRAPTTRIDANGVAVLSDEIDIVNARLQFETGCVANVTASRVSMKTERKMRFFEHDAYVSVDFHNRSMTIHRKGEGEMYPGVPNIDTSEETFGQDDALLAEIDAFLDAIRGGARPLVSGEDGRRALEVAFRISDLIRHPGA